MKSKPTYSPKGSAGPLYRHLQVFVFLIGLAGLAGFITAGCGSTDSPGDSADINGTGDSQVADDLDRHCEGTLYRCEEGCLDLATDPDNCGGCGAICPVEEGEQLRCLQGRCMPNCPDGQVVCEDQDGCFDLNQNREHCGQCGEKCLDGEMCSDGECVLVCPPGQAVCDSQCVDTMADPLNCGDCGQSCSTGQVCSAGECSSTCEQGLTLCDEYCVDTANSHLHCGGCNRTCPASNYCQNGVCNLWCPSDLENCSNACVNTASTPAHCGECGNQCPPRATCVNGQCFTPVNNVRLNRTEIMVPTGSSSTLVATIDPAEATNQAVTWASDDESVATVDNNGNVTAMGPGNATVWVTTVDRGRRAYCPVTVSQPITGIIITPPNLDLSAGNSRRLGLELVPANTTINPLTNITWTSSSPEVAVVDIEGTVRGVAPGEAVITATALTSTGSVSSECVVTVTIVPVTGLVVSPTTLNLIQNRQGTLTATVRPANASNKGVKWISADPAIATVDDVEGSGRVTGRASGTTLVSAITDDGGFTAVTTVTVDMPVTMVTLDKSFIRMERHSTEQLTASIVPSGATNHNVSWSSSNPAVATPDMNGKILAVDVGTATITVTTAEGGHEAYCEVEVWETPVTRLTVSPSAIELFKGNQEALTFVVDPKNASDKRVYWSSSDATIASVDEDGVVTANNYGETTITGTSAYSNSINSSVAVLVPTPVTGITILQDSVELELGETLNLDFAIDPPDATNQNVIWTSSDTTAVSVNEFGKLTGIGPTTDPVVVTVRTMDGDFTDTCLVTILSLYPFTSHSFTNCSKTGRTGPTLAQCQSAYSSVDWTTENEYFDVDSGIQIWTVPATATYRIEVWGASGGDGNQGGRRAGGKGAKMQGDFALTSGEKLKILVGQQGIEETSYTHRAGGGGGGTFVTKMDNTPLIIAGGGGGGGNANYGGQVGHDANITTSGVNGANGTSGGNNGNAGASGDYGSGGAGLLQNSNNGTSSSDVVGARAFVNGGAGGYANSWATQAHGGFGGGGGSGLVPGGGGGYSGGAAGSGWSSYGTAGGGGSYNVGENPENTKGARTGHGEVKITHIIPGAN